MCWSCARRSGNTRRAHQTPDGRNRAGAAEVSDSGVVNSEAGNCGGKIDGQQFLVRRRGGRAGAREAASHLSAVLTAGNCQTRRRVFEKFKSDGGKSQRGQGEVMLDVGGLRFFAAQEFAAGGQIEKKLADFDAWRQARCRRL